MRATTGAFGRAIFAAALAAALPAQALWDDRLEVFVQENVTRDSNVFRISDDVDAAGSIRSSARGDTVYTTSLGFNLDVPVSLQRFQLAYTWFDARYRRFDDLDHNGHIARAAWKWALTTRFTGEAVYQEQRGLGSFANIQGRVPDFIRTRTGYVDAAWMFGASWRLHGLASAGEVEHSSARAVNDLRAASAEAGVSYVTARENRIGVAVRTERGRNPRETLLFGLPFDNEYEQESVGVQGRWVVTGLSRLDGRVDYTRRRYEQLSERDYSGPTFSLTHTYTPTGKVTIATTARRDVAPLQDITSSFVLVTSLTVRPDWAVTEKINVRGHFAYARWEYQGDPLLSQDFEHRIRTAGVSVMYRPTRRIALTGGVSREVRTSTLANADYTVDTAMLEARIGF